MESRMKASKSIPMSLSSVHRQTKSVNQISFMTILNALFLFFLIFPFYLRYLSIAEYENC